MTLHELWTKRVLLAREGGGGGGGRARNIVVCTVSPFENISKKEHKIA